MDKNWATWWIVVVLSTVFTIVGLILRIRGWKND